MQLSTPLNLHPLFFKLPDHEETGIKEPSYAVIETVFLAPREARRRRARYAFVPACRGELLN